MINFVVNGISHQINDLVNLKKILKDNNIQQFAYEKDRSISYHFNTIFNIVYSDLDSISNIRSLYYSILARIEEKKGQLETSLVLIPSESVEAFLIFFIL